MRIGLNPNKDKLDNSKYLHQIIIPVFIPNMEGYFQESFEILKKCITSLINSCQKFSYISLVSNGSCIEVEDYLKKLYEEKKVQEIILTTNIGKFNSIIKALAGHKMPLVTISDADVFFMPAWQKETLKIFENFSRVGTVGIIPQFLSYQSHCENLLFRKFFSKNLKFGRVEDAKALEEFYKSIGWEPNYPPERLKYTLYLFAKKQKAIVGSGHVVATYRRELFEGISLHNSYKMGGNSERILDSLAPQKSYYRLTTAKNFAYHLGNKQDEKLLEQLKAIPRNPVENIEFPELSIFKESGMSYVTSIKRKIIQEIFKSYKLRKQFLKYLGLPGEASQSF